jgi:hypothetical protein
MSFGSRKAATIADSLFCAVSFVDPGSSLADGGRSVKALLRCSAEISLWPGAAGAAE